MTVAESLKRFRTEFKLSQKEVAQSLGKIPQAYYRYESGEFQPRANDLIKLAQKYNVTTDYLLGLSDEPRPTPQEVREKEFFIRAEESINILQEALKKVTGRHAYLQNHEPT